MAITKSRGSRRRGVGGTRRRSNGQKRDNLRTEAEQLDYEMELLKAQREGREEQFKEEERAKQRTRRAKALDDEMDDYFKKKDEVKEGGEGATGAEVERKQAEEQPAKAPAATS